MIAPPGLEIRHSPEHGPHAFRVVGSPDEQQGPVVEIASPFTHPVAGLPESNLMRELRWYLEDFLDYPFPPETVRAERLLAALKDWGQAAFRALLGSRPLAEGNVAVVADDPRVFGWPWEALTDKQGHWLSEACAVERRPSVPASVADLPTGLARDRVRILLVIARSGENDVRFRSLARPVVELIERERLPAEIEVLRPPTFPRLWKHLEEQNRAGRPYHLVHFDGHGHFGLCPDPQRRDGRRTGWLLFEDGAGQPDWIDAERFSQELSRCGVPAVVLNACQSALVEAESGGSSASVAHALLRAGVRAVVAMSYSVYVSAARAFLPAFYRQLFATGRLTDAVHAGRRELHKEPERVCARGTFPLRDALIPVVYQQSPLTFAFAGQARREEATPSRLPDETRAGFDAVGFVGRDGPILQLERALHDPHRAAILIQGMGGQGKTALAKAFLRWLEQTGGLGDGVFWFSFEGCRSAEPFFNRLGEQLFGPDFGRQKWEERRRQVTAECRKRRLRIVWDNFESVRGVPGTAVAGLLTDEDGAALRQFLLELREGRSKVLLTSRAPESWLDPERGQPPSVLRLRSLGGLDGEERWELARAVLEAQGLTGGHRHPGRLGWLRRLFLCWRQWLGRRRGRNEEPGRLAPHLEGPALREMIEALGGHPLSMRAVLPKLRDRPASELTAALRNNAEGLRSSNADEAEVRLFAMLKLAKDDLPEEWWPLLVGLSLHEGFVDTAHLEAMARQVDAGCTRGTVDAFLGALAAGGLLRDHGHAVFEMHPALSGFLRTTLPEEGPQRQAAAWGSAFVAIMSSAADQVVLLQAHQQRGMVQWHLANFQTARRAAQDTGMHTNYSVLTQALAMFAFNWRDYRTAWELYLALADHSQQREEAAWASGAYHQLGMVAWEQRDFAAARQWYLKSLTVKEQQGDEPKRRHHLLPTGQTLRGRAGLRQRPRLVSEVPRHQREAGHRVRRGQELSPTGHGRC